MIHINGSRSQLKAHGISLKEGSIKEMFEVIRLKIYMEGININKLVLEREEASKLVRRFEKMYQQVGSEMISLLYPERLRSDWLKENYEEINKMNLNVWISDLSEIELTKAEIKKAYIYKVIMELYTYRKEYSNTIMRLYPNYFTGWGVSMNKSVKLVKQLLKRCEKDGLFTDDIKVLCKKTLLKKFDGELSLKQEIEEHL